MIEVTTNSYTKYALVGKAISTLPDDSGEEVDIVWGMWHGIGGYSEPAWERMGRPANFGSTWEDTFSRYEHFKDVKTITAYGFTKGHVTGIKRITITTITSVDTEDELVHTV